MEKDSPDKKPSSSESSSQITYSIRKTDENYEDSLKIAEKYKEEANQFLSANKFLQAIELYTKAIDLKIETEKNAIYLTNRGFANFKIENYGLTILDTTDALKHNPNYIKAYYRRGQAYNLLGKLDEAISDLKHIRDSGVKDPDLEALLNKVINNRKRKQFFQAFSSEDRGKPNMAQILKTLKEPGPDYKGPIYKGDAEINDDFCVQIMDFLTDLDLKKKDNEKYLDERSLVQMLSKAKDILSAEKDAILDVNIPENIKFNVIGDIHGQFYDLKNIFKTQGYPSEKNWFLFNGDFVDRGAFGVECVTTLLSWKIRYPKYFYLSRGNHEGINMNNLYGFKQEVIKKYSERVYDCFIEFFYSLPLGHVLNKDILVVHGGLFSQDGVKISDLKKIDRFHEIPEKGLFSELLWADPCKEKGRIPSKRGLGMAFGPDVAEKFLKENGLSLLIRSHEVKMEGYEIEPGEQVITLFSAPNYCDTMGNKGAVIELVNVGGKLEKKFITFTAVEHPKVPSGMYMNLPYFR